MDNLLDHSPHKIWQKAGGSRNSRPAYLEAQLERSSAPFQTRPEVSPPEGLYLIYFHHNKRVQPPLDNIAMAFRKRCCHLPRDLW